MAKHKNNWRKNALPQMYSGHFVTQKGQGTTMMPFDLNPWHSMPDAEAATFTSALCGEDPLTVFDGTDYRPLENVRYVTGTLDGAVSFQEMPLRFLEDVLFPLDTEDESEVLAFVKKWGVPCCPYFDSKRLLLQERTKSVSHPASGGKGPLGRKRRSKQEADEAQALADYVADGWEEIEAWRERYGWRLDADGRSKSFETAVRESEGIRRELEFTGSIEDGRKAVSLNEAALTLEFLREFSALFLALDISGGDVGTAENIMLNFGVTPKVILGAAYPGETAESLLARTSEERTADAKLFAELLSSQDVLISGLVFFSTYVFEGGGLYFNQFSVFPKDSDNDWLLPYRQSIPSGIGEAITTQLLGICTLDAEWRYCEYCGRPFKRHAKRDGTEGNVRRVKTSPYCSPNCQQRSRREMKRRAEEFVISQMDDYLFVEKDERKISSVLSSACELANEKWPAYRDSDKNPIVTLKKAWQLFGKEKERRVKRR